MVLELEYSEMATFMAALQLHITFTVKPEKMISLEKKDAEVRRKRKDLL